MPYTAYGTEYTDLGTREAPPPKPPEQQQAAPDAGQQTGGGRQQRPVTMNQNTVGAVTSDGQVIQNPGYTPDAKRQDAFDNYARAGMRKNAEASRQQYFDTIRANESLQNDQFKRGVDEVNQRGFNLYGVLDNIDKAGGKDLSPEQGRMLEAATTDFGKQVAKNYGWQFNGAEYDWDKGTFTFQFQNDKGQIGTKTMSRDALNAQMVKAGYIDDPVEVRKREMAEEAERQKTDLATAKFAADLGFKQDELNQKIAAADKEHIVKLIDVASKLRGEDGQLDDFGKAILTYAINGLTGGQNAQDGQQQGGAQQQGYNGAAAQFANSGPGATWANNADGLSGEVKQRINAQRAAAEAQNNWRKEQDAKIHAEKEAKRAANGQSAAQESTSQESRVSKFGGGVREMSAAEQKDAEELADLRRREGNGTLTPGGLARLKELEGKEPLTDAERASMKKAGYGAEAAEERRSVASEMSRLNQEEAGLVKPRSLRSDKGASNSEMSEEDRFNALHSGEGEALPGEERRMTKNGPAAEGLEEMSDEDIARIERNAEGRRREAEETEAYEARGESYRSQFADGPSESQQRAMFEEALEKGKSERADREKRDYENLAKTSAEEERVSSRLDEMLRSRGMRMKDLDEKQIKSISSFIGRDNEDAANRLLDRAEQGMSDELNRRKESSERLRRQISGDVKSAEMTKEDARLAVELKSDIAENYSDVLSDAGLINEDLTSDDYRHMAAAKRYAESRALPGKAAEAGRQAVEDYLYDLGSRGPSSEKDPRKALRRENARKEAESKRDSFERRLRMDEANKAAARANRTMGASTFGGTVYDTVKDVGYGLRKSGKAVAGAAKQAAVGTARAIREAGERAGEEIYTWREAAEDAKKEREERRAKRKNRKGN